MSSTVHVVNVKSVPQFENDCPGAVLVIGSAARRALLQLGMAPYIVFQEYLEEVARDTRNFSDERTALRLGWSTDRVNKARKKLTAAGWFELCECVCTEKVLDVTPAVIVCNIGILDDRLNIPGILKYRVDSNKYDHDCTEAELEERYGYKV